MSMPQTPTSVLSVVFAGQEIVGSSLSVMVMVKLHELEFPEASVMINVLIVVPIGKVLPENIRFGYFTIDSLLAGDYTVQCFVKRPQYNTTSWKIIGDTSFTYTIAISLKEDIRLMVRENYRSSNKYQFYLPLHRNEQDSTCPICKMDDEIIPIRYGLIIPSTNNDKQLQKYRLGGCMVRKDRWYCDRDKIEF